MTRSIKKSTRDSFGEALVEVGRLSEDVVVLDSDLAAATRTQFFKKAFPTRFFDCGISEANMVGVGAGLATVGKIPFIASFAMFCAGRGFEQIRNSVAYPNLNVKIVGSHAGLSAGQDGATHQCCEDIALMRSLPNVVVLNPSDDYETRLSVLQMLEMKGPAYLRLSKIPVENCTFGCKFEIGKGILLKDGFDISIIATGVVVPEVLKAAKNLAVDNIKARVINIHTIKPLDEEIILKAAIETKMLFTVEEHSVIGGLGEAVCSLVCKNSPVVVEKIGIGDEFGQTGDVMELFDYYGLSADRICEYIKARIGVKIGL